MTMSGRLPMRVCPANPWTTAYDMDMTVNATGDSVRITFPDFSSFEEVTVPETRSLN